jgi:hypothetical protein
MQRTAVGQRRNAVAFSADMADQQVNRVRGGAG